MSKNIVSKINKQISHLAGLYNIRDKKLIDELSSSCFDEYSLNLESGKNEKDAYTAALLSTKNTMKSFAEEKLGFKHCNFSIIISLIILVYSILIFFIGQFTPEALYSFGVLYPIFMILVIGIVVYTFITYRKRNAVDYIVITILFIAVLTITIQDFIYLYRARTGDFYYSLNYNFPGILKFNTHWLVSVEPLKYELKNTIILFDPTLISSVVCLIISITNKFIKER